MSTDSTSNLKVKLAELKHILNGDEGVGAVDLDERLKLVAGYLDTLTIAVESIDLRLTRLEVQGPSLAAHIPIDPSRETGS